DYGMGNLGSIRNMLKKIGADSEITAEPARIAAATKLVLPGVGAFDAGMENLDKSGLVPLLNERVRRDEVPVLGICLGMQLMTHSSSEGERPGLGWVDAKAVRFVPADATLKVPHMGWNIARPVRDDALLEGLPRESRFYFVHSYYVACERREDVLLTTFYGADFDSGFRRGNVWGVQFHPEKSHRFGMHLLRNFAERC
ncbi:MAG TPA: imidazole glycerol phosphate synthase subunit HisH, partial [Caldimonas sp.]|nr:imidazole glycerol phosphate synthase subunit HisH [Caldimonas sp.]